MIRNPQSTSTGARPWAPWRAPAKSHHAMITLNVNALAHELDLECRVTLREALLERVGIRLCDLPITPDRLLGA